MHTSGHNGQMSMTGMGSCGQSGFGMSPQMPMGGMVPMGGGNALFGGSTPQFNAMGANGFMPQPASFGMMPASAVQPLFNYSTMGDGNVVVNNTVNLVFSPTFGNTSSMMMPGMMPAQASGMQNFGTQGMGVGNQAALLQQQAMAAALQQQQMQQAAAFSSPMNPQMNPAMQGMMPGQGGMMSPEQMMAAQAMGQNGMIDPAMAGMMDPMAQQGLMDPAMQNPAADQIQQAMKQMMQTMMQVLLMVLQMVQGLVSGGGLSQLLNGAQPDESGDPGSSPPSSSGATPAPSSSGGSGAPGGSSAPPPPPPSSSGSNTGNPGGSSSGGGSPASGASQEAPTGEPGATAHAEETSSVDPEQAREGATSAERAGNGHNYGGLPDHYVEAEQKRTIQEKLDDLARRTGITME